MSGEIKTPTEVTSAEPDFLKAQRKTLAYEEKLLEGLTASIARRRAIIAELETNKKPS